MIASVAGPGRAIAEPVRVAAAAAPSPAPAEPPAMVSRGRSLMGGRVAVHVVPRDAADGAGGNGGADTGHHAAEPDAVLDRIARWADRLTRFAATSELSRLNADPRADVPIGPTLAAVLDWGREAEVLTDGIVDVGLLEARLAAEGRQGVASLDGALPARSLASRAWSLDRRSRGVLVRRPRRLRFDLDGVAKGWIADRALARLDGHAAAVVDADGDIAIRLGRGVEWAFGVADPDRAGHDLCVLRLHRRDGATDRGGAVGSPPADRFGLATSGTSIHRWDRAEGRTHHLIDPRTGRSAVTDLVQATVLAGSARVAEALAKAAVIVGSEAAFGLLDRAGIDGAILLTEQRRLLVHPSTSMWLG